MSITSSPMSVVALATRIARIGWFRPAGCLTALIVCLSSTVCRSETIYDNTGGTFNGVGYVSKSGWRADEFVIGPHSYHLDSIQLHLGNQAPSSSFPGTIRLTLFTDSSGPRPGTDLNTPLPTMLVTVPAFGEPLVTFTPTSPVLLAANTAYWVVLSDSNGDDGIAWTATKTPPVGSAATNFSSITGDSGATWAVAGGDGAYKMRIDATPTATPRATPEPGSLALLASGLLSIVALRGIRNRLPGRRRGRAE